MNSGIYKIAAPSGNFYVGSAINIDKRRWLHLFELRKSRHHCKPLQNAYNKYGEDCLIFSTLFYCEPKDLLFYEQRAIDILKPKYNVCKVAGSRLGLKASEETKERMRGKKSIQHCENLSKSLKISLSTPEARAINSLRQIIAQNQPERLAENSRQQKISQMREEVRTAKAGRKVICVEYDLVFSCGHEAAEWCHLAKLTTNMSAFVWINRAVRDGVKAYGLTWKSFNDNGELNEN
jgi:group I intron endonuclease